MSELVHKQRTVIKVVQPLHLDQWNILISEQQWDDDSGVPKWDSVTQRYLGPDWQWRPYAGFEVLDPIAIPGFVTAAYLPWLDKALSDNAGTKVVTR